MNDDDLVKHRDDELNEIAHKRDKIDRCVYCKLAERDAALARCVEALNYLMDRFDNEMWNCPACGYAEETSTMDSAFYLRDWLKTNSLPTSAQATAKVLAAARRLCDCDVLTQDLWDDLREAIREEQEYRSSENC